MKRIALFTCLSAASLLGFAQEQKDTTALDPVEVRAVRASPMAPFAKTNLSRMDISRQNLGQDLPFLLNQTPSVVVSSDAGNGVGYTGIRIRGTDPTRINVTLNGIPYNDAESNGLFFVNLPDFASSVSSVQIQRGVGTSTNGAGSFGATLNFSTNEINKTSYAEFNNAYGSFNTLKNTIRVGTGLIGDHFTADVRLSRISSDGYIDRAATDLKSFYVSAAYLNEKTTVRLNIFSGEEKTYQAWNGVSEPDLKNNRTANYSGTERPGEPYDNEVDNYRQDHYQLFFTQQLSPRLAFNTALFLTRGLGFYEQYKGDEDYADYGQPYPLVNGDTVYSSHFVRQLWLDNHYFGNVFSLQYTAAKTQWIVGGALTRYTGDHYGKLVWASQPFPPRPKWYDLDASKNDVNLYAKWQRGLSKYFQLFADVQYRGVGYDLEGFRNNPGLFIDNRYHFFNPKVGVTYHRGPWQLYGSYSKAGKEPNRDDFEAGTEEQPRPEHLHDFEAGVEWKNTISAWSANLYYMRYKDQLVLTGMVNDVGAYTRTNIPGSYRLGIELQGSVQVSSRIRASGNLTLSRNRILNFTEFVDDYDNGGQIATRYSKTDISFSPSVVGGATVTVIAAKGLGIDLLGKYVGKQYLDNTGNESRRLKAYYTQDLRAVYSFQKKWLRNADIILQINNIFNTLYEPNGYTFSYYANSVLITENYYFPMAGTNWMVGVNLKL